MWSGVPTIVGSGLLDPAVNVQDLGLGALNVNSGDDGQLECWENIFPLLSEEAGVRFGGEGFRGVVFGEEFERG